MAATVQLLKDQCSVIVDPHIFKEQSYDNYESRYILVKGMVQSGKTLFMISQALYNYINGISTIILLRNLSADKYQFMDRISSAIKELNKKLGYTFCEEDCTIDYTKLVEKPCILVSLGNVHQLNKICQLIEDYNMYHKVSLIIDEVDALDTEKNNGVAQKIIDIKYFVHSIYAVTASVLDTVLQEKIKPDRLIYLPIPPHYKGIKSIEWKELPLEIKSDREFLEKDPNLLPFLIKLSKWKPVYSKIFKEYHPILYLLRITREKAEMELLQDYLRTTFPHITTIVYNSDGIKLWSKHAVDLGKLSGVYTIIKKVSIGSVLLHLKNIGVNIFSHIVIISGEIAGRGISFVSGDYGICLKNNKLGWHIIGEYYTCAKTTKQPDLIQAARLCGIIKDDIPLRWYVRPELRTDIIKAHSIVEEFLERSALHKEKTISETITTIPISKNKLSKRALIKNKTPPKLLKINDSDGCRLVGEILLILPETLKGLSLKYYDKLVNVFLDENSGLGLGLWISKTKLLETVTNGNKKLIELMRNTTHPWHDTNKKALHYKIVQDINNDGLMFKQEHTGGEWYVCYKSMVF